MPRARFSREQERRLKTALATGLRPSCPLCGTALERREVPPSSAVAYVRHRDLYVCGGCGASLVVDRSRSSDAG
jgi:hypothetical protein